MIEHFADSNLLVYASSKKREDARKQSISQLLLENLTPTISIQVLNEFVNVVTHPRKLNLTREVAVELASDFSESLETVPLDLQTHQLAMRWYLPKQLSLWDSLIVASASLANCTTLFSEDMNHGQTFGNVTITNPFLTER